jgi:hypothetical protein
MIAAAKRGWWARDQRVVGIFVPSHQVVRPERATDGLHPLDAVADDAGVVDDRPAVHHAGAAGPAPVLVGAAAGGFKGDPVSAPGDKILRADVAPPGWPPDGSVRVGLEEQVVGALPVDRPVGVVHPVALRGDVILGRPFGSRRHPVSALTASGSAVEVGLSYRRASSLFATAGRREASARRANQAARLVSYSDHSSCRPAASASRNPNGPVPGEGLAPHGTRQPSVLRCRFGYRPRPT